MGHVKNIFPQSEDEAKKLAERLAQELRDTVGGDWQSRVWFNSWWCYDAHLGSMAVKEYIRNTKVVESEMTYSCYINSEKGKTGGTSWSHEGNYEQKTPKEAVENAMKFAQSIVSKYQETLDDNNKLIGNTSEN